MKKRLLENAKNIVLVSMLLIGSDGNLLFSETSIAKYYTYIDATKVKPNKSTTVTFTLSGINF